jgi:polyisoprenoid-binding protein YceI
MKRWIIGIAVAALLVVVGGPFVYFHFIQSDPPPRLTVDSVTTSSTATAGKSGTTGKRAPLAGTWKIGSGSVARYRVKETVFGQSGTAVGETNGVTGSMTIAGAKVTTATFTVDMTSFKSDQSQRDGQFHGRIMDTANFPTATFTLTSPIDLAPVPADGAKATYSANGKLTLHGTTKAVTFPLTTKRTGDVIAVQSDKAITFADYGINNPSGGPASVGNSGELEFLLQLQPS